MCFFLIHKLCLELLCCHQSDLPLMKHQHKKHLNGSHLCSQLNRQRLLTIPLWTSPIFAWGMRKATHSFAEVDDEVTAWRLWLQTIKKQQRQFAVNCIHHCVKTRIPPTGTNKHWPGSSITSTKNYIPWALATSSAPYGVTLVSRFHLKKLPGIVVASIHELQADSTKCQCWVVF